MLSKKILYFLFCILFFSVAINLIVKSRTTVAAATTLDVFGGQSAANDPGDWPTVGANAARSSWNSEEVPGQLRPVWYKQFEPYISQKVQIIAALDTLYVSTAAGLYALDAETGAERWVYPTALPLGHSPTIDTERAIAYVGGFDHKIHAVNAHTGEGLWTFEAGAGFHTNPLLAEGKIFAGNRDGTFYAIYADGPYTGMLAWSFATGGPILYSAAYQDGVLYFASNDSHAYALEAATGELIWKSQKLPGSGFHSWWPVIHNELVIFAGSRNYKSVTPDGTYFGPSENTDVYPDRETDPRGTYIGLVGSEPGAWVAGTRTILADRIVEYFEDKPWRRTYFVLNRFTGQEVEYAPVLWTGTNSGNRYPPIVGQDGVLYQQNNYMSDPSIPGGHVSGWQPGTPYISVITNGWNAVDEPMAYSAGGNLIYWSNCCDRAAGAIDISSPVTSIDDRDWSYFSYNLTEILPGYNERYYNPRAWDFTLPGAVFGGPDGVYGNHGDNNPPVPYHGKVYVHRSNAILAFDDSGNPPLALPTAKQVPSTELTALTRPLTSDELVDRLIEEVQKIVSAGHLRPAYADHGTFDIHAKHVCGDNLVDYWHSSSDAIYTLTRAWEYLPTSLQESVKTYLDYELANYPPYRYSYLGWEGTAREVFDIPPELPLDDYLEPVEENYSFRNFGGWNAEGVWGRNPFTFYSLWKYAERFGVAPSILTQSAPAFWEEFGRQPSDELLRHMPEVHNAYIAGYLGFTELQKLAGYAVSPEVEAELIRLLSLRAQNLSPDSPYPPDEFTYCRSLDASRNFIYLVPELATYLQEHVPEKVAEVVGSYEYHAPYWFVGFAEEGYAENAITALHDTHGLFLAKAWMQNEYQQVLQQYLDVPAFPRGDLFYVQKLIATIEAEEAPAFILSVDPTRQSVMPGEPANFTITIRSMADFNTPVLLTISAPSEIEIELGENPVSTGHTLLTLTDKSGTTRSSRVTITATAEDLSQSVAVVLETSYHGYLPLVTRRSFPG